MTTVTIEGRKWVSMNGSHRHPRAHQAAMQEWKNRAIVAIREARPAPLAPPVQILAVVRRVRAGRADAHNVLPSIKAGIDAAVSCGWIPEDHDDIVSRLIIEAGPKAKVPTIELTIEPAWQPCDRGVCAAPLGHPGTCAEASGWDQ